METKEVIKEIKLIPKAYTHVGMQQSTFSNTIKAIETGRAKQSTINDFLGLFGYKANELTWTKQS